MRILAVNLVARLRDHVRARLEGDHASWLWKHLRRAFPEALACMFMPNHVHLLVCVPSARLAHASFVKVLAAFARAFRIAAPVWQPIPAPTVIEPTKVLTLVRYYALNPAWARLAKDPLGWHWSTHLDICDAVADPWVTIDDLRPFFRGGVRDIETFHHYVSSDSKVRVDGTPLPVAASETSVATRPLDDILLAATAATRGTRGDHRRRGPTRDAFIWLAATHGWRDVARLAKICGITNNALRKILRDAPPAPLRAARLVLGDARLMSAARRAIGSPSIALDDETRAPPSNAA